VYIICVFHLLLGVLLPFNSSTKLSLFHCHIDNSLHNDIMHVLEKNEWDSRLVFPQPVKILVLRIVYAEKKTKLNLE
jgi:hypothetical protein